MMSSHNYFQFKFTSPLLLSEYAQNVLFNVETEFQSIDEYELERANDVVVYDDADNEANEADVELDDEDKEIYQSRVDKVAELQSIIAEAVEASDFKRQQSCEELIKILEGLNRDEYLNRNESDTLHCAKTGTPSSKIRGYINAVIPAIKKFAIFNTVLGVTITGYLWVNISEN